MLSVLIPTYNYNAYSLVEEIHQQLTKASIVFEIICLDDGSNSEINTENEHINTFTNASFNSLKENVGRSFIRNLLAKTAKYDWLLFLDADVFPVSKQFIENYIKLINQEKTVFCGGLKYEDKIENKHLLRYKFGKKHEEISVEKRKINSEKYFFTSNFLIKKDVFDSVFFEEKLIEYGREDMVFSINLVKNGFVISHIENEVYHLGLDENNEFVEKTKSAMKNLMYLRNENIVHEKDMPILRLLTKLKILKLETITSFFYPFFEKLTINYSSVFFLNCMKVSYLCYLNMQHEKR